MTELQVEIAVCKIGKYATSESGDTLEVVERPRGGLSLVLADGQRSGKAAKSISNIVVRKAVSLLAEGVRDGAVARAAHDYLSTIRGGKVSATLNIVSVDLMTETLVISRNSHCPTVVVQDGELVVLDAPSPPVGIHSWTKPSIDELPLAPGICVVAFTDGVLHAGQRADQRFDVPRQVQALAMQDGVSAQSMADAILSAAVARDEGRPSDDISVLVLRIVHARPDNDGVRRLTIDFPARLMQRWG
jgi:serine phosphatase RsbU (regulator of sigma subunit)